jgi:Ca2+-binding RTX toxin-like protein
MTILTAQEQLLLELVNRARLDPWAETVRLGIDLNQGLPAGTLDYSIRQPLAGNAFLNSAAEGHSNWMLAADVFSHTGSGSSTATSRMSAAGYVFNGSWSAGENIAWSGSTGAIDATALTRSSHDNLFLSASHRTNILGSGFREIGVAAEVGQFTSGGTTYNALVVTENFASSWMSGYSGTGLFVTGVSYTDHDGDRFYSVGEAVAGRTVAVAQGGVVLGSGSTQSAGGYSVWTGATGDIDVTFSGAGLATARTVTVATGGQNVKVDLVNGDLILSSATTTLGSGANRLELLGAGNINGIGNALNNEITGNRGANALVGGAGNDTLYGVEGADWLSGGDGHDVLDGGLGADTVLGGSGSDTISVYFGPDSVDAGDGDDLVYAFAGITGSIMGGAGSDALWFFDWETSGRSLDLNAPAGLTIGGFEAIGVWANSGNDTIVGSTGTDYLYGNAGNDLLVGGDGNDIIVGGEGSDIISGGRGNDYMVAEGAGSDWFYFNWGGDVRAGDFDAVAGFRDGIDLLVFDSSLQGYLYGVDYAGYGAIFFIATGGGYYGVGVPGLTIAQVQDQIVYA